MKRLPPSSRLFPYTTLFRSPPAATWREWRPSGCSRIRTCRSFRAPLGAQDARTDVQGQHGQGDQKGAAPGQLFPVGIGALRSEEHTSELQSHSDLVCRLLLE